MKEFMGKDFLLENETAKKLFHEHAAKMPIIDYHCHINPQQIAENHAFKNIAEAWLGGDHYKWRMIRSNGVAETYITGKESTDRRKIPKVCRSFAAGDRESALSLDAPRVAALFRLHNTA